MLAEYKMRSILIFIVVITLGFSTNAQRQDSTRAEPYEYDTTLKGGYRISFAVDDSLEYLYLKKGNRTIRELSSISTGLLYKNLGYIGADFRDYFVLVHSFGAGNPHYIELIKKTTGSNALKGGAAWIAADEKKEFLLYSEKDVPNEKDKMTLLNVRSGQRQRFSFPKNIFDAPQVLNRIEISRLTNKQLVIKYTTEKGSRMRVYNR